MDLLCIDRLEQLRQLFRSPHGLYSAVLHFEFVVTIPPSPVVILFKGCSENVEISEKSRRKKRYHPEDFISAE